VAPAARGQPRSPRVVWAAKGCPLSCYTDGVNRRGRRFALGALGLGLAVLLVLVLAHWGTAREVPQ
jgi:hypothetical protein